MNRYKSMIGEQARNSHDVVLGTITSILHEDNQWFAVINEEYELPCSGCMEVILITHGKHYIRFN